MYDKRCSPQFVDGVHTFLLAAKANKRADGFCNRPKIGLSIFVLLFSPGTHFQNFLLSLLDDSEKFCHFQPFKTLLMSFSVGKTSFASAPTLSNPNSKFLEFECGLCDYKGVIIFLDLLIIPSVPRDPPILLILGYAKILLSPMQYF